MPQKQTSQGRPRPSPRNALTELVPVDVGVWSLTRSAPQLVGGVFVRIGMRFRVAILAVLTISLAAPAAASSAPRSGCEKLKGSDLAPARSVKLVDRGGLLRSCSFPKGRVRLLESGLNGDEVSEVHYVRRVVGAFAVVTNVYYDKYATAEGTYVVNLRTGKKRTLASTQQDAMSAPQPPDTRVASAFVTAGGRAAAAVLAPGDLVRVAALGAKGGLRILAEAPRSELATESLTLTGSTIGWTQSRLPRTARLP